MGKTDGNVDLKEPKQSKGKRLRLYVPELPLVYTANKLYQVFQKIDTKLLNDPLFISIKDYIFLVKELEKCNDELVKRGLNTANGRAKARVEQKKLDKLGNKKYEAGVGEAKSSSLDNGVSTSNPFA